MTDGIILAGGYGRRAKGNKVLFSFRDKTILDHVVAAMRPHVENIIVVTGFYHTQIDCHLKDVSDVTVIHNPRYDEGMFTSVKIGVAMTKGDFFILPGDMPLVKASTFETLLKAEGRVRVATYNNRRGHPVWFSKTLKNALLSEPDSSNLKVFRDRYDVKDIACGDEGILIDIDSIKDYKWLLSVSGEENES